MVNETEIKSIWNILKVVGAIVIILSLGAGIFIIGEFGTDQITYTTTEYNIIGIATGVAVMFQGFVTGILLIAFSALGESVNMIESSTVEKSE